MSKGDAARLLGEMPIFQSLSVRELELMSMVMREVTVSAGDPICREGEPGSTCYFIVSGVVEVYKNVGSDSRLITTLHDGQLFGHLALVDAGPRTATCVAATPTHVLTLERRDFDALFTNNTRFAFKFQDVIARTAARQLRIATERLSMLMSQSQARTAGNPRSTGDMEAIRDLAEELSRSSSQVKLD
jgi:CRP-like cAMP-binding protein